MHLDIFNISFLSEWKMEEYILKCDKKMLLFTKCWDSSKCRFEAESWFSWVGNVNDKHFSRYLTDLTMDEGNTTQRICIFHNIGLLVGSKGWMLSDWLFLEIDISCPPTTLPEGNVFTCVCLFTGGLGRYLYLLTPTYPLPTPYPLLPTPT